MFIDVYIMFPLLCVCLYFCLYVFLSARVPLHHDVSYVERMSLHFHVCLRLSVCLSVRICAAGIMESAARNVKIREPCSNSSLVRYVYLRVNTLVKYINPLPFPSAMG